MVPVFPLEPQAPEVYGRSRLRRGQRSIGASLVAYRMEALIPDVLSGPNSNLPQSIALFSTQSVSHFPIPVAQTGGCLGYFVFVTAVV